MLSKCAPFSQAVQDASKGGVQPSLSGIVTSTTGEKVTFRLDKTDIQSVIDWNGVEHPISGSNIKQLVGIYHGLFPGLRPAHLALTFVVGESTKTADIDLLVMNPELISTAAKRILREFNG